MLPAVHQVNGFGGEPWCSLFLPRTPFLLSSANPFATKIGSIGALTSQLPILLRFRIKIRQALEQWPSKGVNGSGEKRTDRSDFQPHQPAKPLSQFLCATGTLKQVWS